MSERAEWDALSQQRFRTADWQARTEDGSRLEVLNVFIFRANLSPRALGLSHRGSRPLLVLDSVPASAVTASSTQGTTIAPPFTQNRCPGDLDTTSITEEMVFHGFQAAHFELWWHLIRAPLVCSSFHIPHSPFRIR